MGLIERMPDEIREFSDKLDAWNLAAAEWLGLDPQRVTKLDVTERDEYGYVVAWWESVGFELPRCGHVEAGARSDGDVVILTGRLTLDLPDAEAFRAAVGPKPEMFTAEERARLEAALRGRA